MSPELFSEFCAELTREVNRLRIERGADLAGWRSEFEKVDRELDKMVDAILQGFPPAKLKDKAEKLEARKAELTEFLDNADEPPPLLHPNMAQMYQDRIAKLCENLQSEEDRSAAVDVLRSPVNEINLVPQNGELSIVLRGDLGAILRFAADSKTPTSFRRPRLWTTCFRRNRWLREGAADDSGTRAAQMQKPPQQDRRRHRKIVDCGGRI